MSQNSLYINIMISFNNNIIFLWQRRQKSYANILHLDQCLKANYGKKVKFYECSNEKCEKKLKIKTDKNKY